MQIGKFQHVRAINVEMWHPNELPDTECRSIAKSCARYSLAQFSDETYSEINTRKIAKRWHGKYDFDFKARNDSIRSLRELGCTQQEIADTVGIGQRRASKILKTLDVETDSRTIALRTRNQAIVDARLQGASIDELIHIHGLQKSMIYNILAKHDSNDYAYLNSTFPISALLGMP